MENKLIQQVNSLKDLVEPQLVTAFKNVDESLTFPEILNVRRIYITGSGDSYAAGIALKRMFEAYGDTFGVDVLKTIYFTRYISKEDYEKEPHGSTLLIGISNGGESARTVEALSMANELGYLTLAITNNKNSTCAKTAQKLLHLDIEKPEYVSVGLRSYLAIMFALTALIVKFGRVRGTISSMKEEAIKKSILELFNRYDENYADYNKQAKEIAERIHHADILDFIADDIHQASAYFVAAKFTECTGKLFSLAESENWCHLHAYLKEDYPIPTFVFANKNQASYSRLVETAQQATKMGRDVYVVGDVNPKDFSNNTLVLLPSLDGDNYPHIYFEYIPLSLVVGYVQDIVGSLDFSSKDHLKFGTTSSSKVESLESLGL